MFWLQTLVAIHVLSALIGIGPTFLLHALIRAGQTPAQLRHSLALMSVAERFPKVGGPLAVLSGILLVALYDYGGFGQLWLAGSLALFVLIQIVVVGVAGRQLKPAVEWKRGDGDGRSGSDVPPSIEASLRSARGSLWVAHALAVALFLLMILKPTTPLW
ncbi:DUF2269 family protein [Paenibacillus sp.]|uniref:DUF2269 family protein n=1 Tax=Paenibacillus sp. TaxID=58172 RepID=UPI002D2CD72A|nr:DUF2269 family protein [Paenibacillus sp.]HZG56255.1 DUF2269 family protein [Paenibacillus sp.]